MAKRDFVQAHTGRVSEQERGDLSNETERAVDHMNGKLFLCARACICMFQVLHLVVNVATALTIGDDMLNSFGHQPCPQENTPIYSLTHSLTQHAGCSIGVPMACCLVRQQICSCP